MVYDPQFSPQEAELFFVLSGSRPPLASRDKMLGVSDALLEAAQRVGSELTPALSRVTSRVLMGMDSAVSVEFAKSMEPMTSAPPYYLPTLEDQYRQMAAYTEISADEFLRLKVDSIVILASLLVAIAIDLILIYFGEFEFGLELMASELAIVRFLLTTMIGRLLLHLIMVEVMSIAIQEALDVIGQLWLNAELHQDWSWAESAMMFEVGALGGAMGLVLMPLDRVLAGFLGRALLTGADAVLGKVFGTELGDLGKDVVLGAGEFTAGALVGGVHNAGHETLFNAMQGNGWHWSWGTFSGGAAMGVTAVIALGLARGFKLAKMNATLPAEQLLARGLGDINPTILTDIATAGQPLPGGPKGGTALGTEAVPGEAAVPPAVALLKAAGIQPGPETAYSVALRTGFVPTVGSPSEHPLFARSVTASIPMAGFVLPGQARPVLPGTVTAQPEQTAALPPGQRATPEPTAEPATQAAEPTIQASAEPMPQPVNGHPVPSAGQQVTVPPTTRATAEPATQAAAEPLPQPVNEPPVLPAGGQQPPVTRDPGAEPVVTEQVPQPGSVLPGHQVPGQQETAQPALGSSQAASETAQPAAGEQPLPQQPERPSETSGGTPGAPAPDHLEGGGGGAGVKRDAAPAETTGVTAHGDQPPQPGVASGGPGAAGVPGALGDAGRPHELLAAGTQWARSDGWYVSRDPGTLQLRLGAGGEPRAAELPPGSRAVFDRSGELQYVVTPEGDSFVRGLDGQLSPSGALEVRKTSETVLLETGDGQPNVVLGRENEAIVENGVPIAYREVTRRFIDGGGASRAGENKAGVLSQPRTFLSDGKGGWVEASSPVDSARFQAWLAGANKAHEEARFLHDIADRNSPELPVGQRLSTMSDAALKHLYEHGSVDDRYEHGSVDGRFAAVYEAIGRGGPGVDGKAARWTQIKAIRSLVDRAVVDQKTGEGKTLGFIGAAGILARGDATAVHYYTSHDHLAETGHKEMSAVWGPRDVKVYRMDPNNPPPPAGGEPTIYVGTPQDGAFYYLKSGLLFGQKDTGDPAVFDALVDEFDKTFAYDRSGGYYISSGERGLAPEQTAAQVREWNQFLTDHLDREDGLTAADFGRFPGQAGGSAALTEQGRAKAAELADRDLTPDQERLLNDAAAARLGLVLNDDYVVHDGEIVIMDQTTGYPLKDPGTANSSRWFTYAPHLEAVHGLPIRTDPGGSKHTTNKDFFTLPGYGGGQRVRGASGTAAGWGKEAVYQAQGLPGETTRIPRYYASRLKASDPRVFPDEEAKLDAMAADIKQKWDGGNGKPQLTIFPRNSQVAELSRRLRALDVPHQAIDGHWMLNQGAGLEPELARAREQTGQPGMVTIANNVFGRGADFKTSFTVKEAGGLDQRTGGLGLPDILEQAANRAGRSGDPGTTGLDYSVQDTFLTNSHDPYVHFAIAHYTQADHDWATAFRNWAKSRGGDNPAQAGADADALHQAEQVLKTAIQYLRDIVSRHSAQVLRDLGFNVPIPPAPAFPTPPPPQPPPGQPAADGNGNPAQAAPATKARTDPTPAATAAGNGHVTGAPGTGGELGNGHVTGAPGTGGELGNGHVTGAPGTGGELANGAGTPAAATAHSDGQAGPLAAGQPAPASAEAREQQLQDLRAEQQELTKKLSVFMITPEASAALQARLTEVNAAIQQHTAEAGAAASQHTPAPAPEQAAAPEQAVVRIPGAPADPEVLRKATRLSFVTGTTSSRTAEQAAEAVPGARTGQGRLWKTVGGHAGPGFIEVQGAQLSVAEALELPGVRDYLETAQAIVLNLSYALAAAPGLLSVAQHFAAATGKPVLATDQQVIVSGHDVVSGRMGAGQNGVATAERDGTWKLLHADGAVHDLGTSSLLDAYAKLGLTPLPAGPAPAEVFAFGSQPEHSGSGGALGTVLDQRSDLIAQVRKNLRGLGWQGNLADHKIIRVYEQLKDKPAAGHGTAAIASSVASVIADPRNQGRMKGGGSGIEAEFPYLLTFSNEHDLDQLLTEQAELAYGPDGTFSVVVEQNRCFRGDDRKYYRTEADARTAGRSRAIKVMLAMPEFVSEVTRAFSGESGYQDNEPVFTALSRLEQILAELPGEAGSQPEIRLSKVLRRKDGFYLTGVGRRTFIGPKPVGDGPGANVQYTFGVPLTGLYSFLEHVLDHTRPDEKGYLRRAHLGDGLAFGSQIAFRFMMERYLPGGDLPPGLSAEDELARRSASDPAVAQLRGYVALLYTGAATVAHAFIYDGNNRKDNAAVLARHDMGQILAALPPEVRDYLSRNADDTMSRFERSFRNRIPGFDDRFREIWFAEGGGPPR